MLLAKLKNVVLPGDNPSVSFLNIGAFILLLMRIDIIRTAGWFGYTFM